MAKFRIGEAGRGALEGAAIGGSLGGPWGAAAGAVIGGVAGGFGGKKSMSGGSNNGMLDAFGLGLRSLSVAPFGREGPQEIKQVTNINQETGVNVTNVLGGRNFGQTPSGEFSEFQAIADVFAIRDELEKKSDRPVVIATQAQPANLLNGKSNLLPFLVLGGVAIFILTRR